MPDPTLLTGRVLRVLDNPFDAPPEDALKIEDKWGLLIEAGRISDLGPAEQMRMAYPVVTEIAYGSDLICPGFIDAHVHLIATTADLGSIGEDPASLTTMRASKIAEGMLMRVFITVRDAGGADWGLALAIEEGLIQGPRLFYSGRVLSQLGAQWL